MTKSATLEEPVVEQMHEVSLNQFLKSLKIASYDEEQALVPMISEGLLDVNEEVSDAARLISSLATIIWNIDPGSSRLDKGKIQGLISQINQMINDQVNEIIPNDKFKELESTWRGLFDLISGTNFRANVMIDMLGVSKEELNEDFENNSVDFLLLLRSRKNRGELAGMIAQFLSFLTYRWRAWMLNYVLMRDWANKLAKNYSAMCFE